MNAPLPPGVLADQAELARRLARETEGEVLFDTASRGRYATDASIYQAMPIGVFLPKTARDVAIALQVERHADLALVAGRREDRQRLDAEGDEARAAVEADRRLVAFGHRQREQAQPAAPASRRVLKTRLFHGVPNI